MEDAKDQAQDIVKDSSFGYDKSISPNSFGIPGWSMLGEGHVPGLLSDKVTLRRTQTRRAVGGARPEFCQSRDLVRVGWAEQGVDPISVHGGQIRWPGTHGRYTWRDSEHRGFLNDGSTEYRSRRPRVRPLRLQLPRLVAS